MKAFRNDRYNDSLSSGDALELADCCSDWYVGYQIQIQFQYFLCPKVEETGFENVKSKILLQGCDATVNPH